MGNRCLVIGDVHGDFNRLKWYLNELEPDLCISTGDWGYWPRYLKFEDSWRTNKIPIYFCEGNHEDYFALESLETNEVADNIFYMKRGSTLKLPDGRKALFFGGALSIDRNNRTLGFDYFPQEIITLGNLYSLPDNVEADIIISHTCPNYFDLEIDKWEQDPSQVILDQLFDLVRPKKWFFSHWHKHLEGKYKGCEWHLLNMMPHKVWYKWLDSS